MKIINLAFIQHPQATEDFNRMVMWKEHFALDEGANNACADRIKFLLNRYICRGIQYPGTNWVLEFLDGLCFTRN